jgi:D-galactarolactone cycloisomerase
MQTGNQIRQVRIHHLEAPLSERFGWSLNWTSTRRSTLVQVIDGEGRSGWGDGTFGGDRLFRNPDLVINRFPDEVEGIYEALRPDPVRQSRRGPQDCGGLDTAIWDLLGKQRGLPVCRLLGHVYRDRLQPYCTALYRKDWPDLAAGLAEEAAGWKAKGFRVMKMKVGYGVEVDVRNVRAVRAVIGPDIGLAIDANCAYDAAGAALLANLVEDCDISWFEEPVSADDLSGYREMKQRCRVPLAGGETLPLDNLLRDYVEPRLVDILQPEVEIVGLTGARRLSHACWLHRVRLVPHNWSTAIRTAAILQWMATCPPLTEGLESLPMMFEFDQTENPLRDAVVQTRLAPESDGLISVPTAPGLGMEVDEAAVARFRHDEIVLDARS